MELQNTSIVELDKIQEKMDPYPFREAIKLIAAWADTAVENVTISPVWMKDDDSHWGIEVSIGFWYKAKRARKEKYHVSHGISTSLLEAAQEALNSVKYWKEVA